MPFRIGLSGLNAAAADLEVTGNNIANTGTVGFKESRAEFADIFAQAYGGISKTAIGSGVRLAATTQQFSQGNIEYTENALDLAINGEGFFVLNDSGERLYSRAGEFQVDRDGYVVNSAGQRLQVYPQKDDQTADESFTVGSLNDLQLPLNQESAALGTTRITTNVNLSSSATQPIDPATGEAFDAVDITNPDSYNWSTSLNVYDSEGAARTMTLYFVKNEDPLQWTVYAELDGMTPTPEPPVTPEGTFDITFDSNGNLDLESTERLQTLSFDLEQYSPINGATIGPLDPTTATETSPDGLGANPGDVIFDLSTITQYGSSYSVNDLTQDGYPNGTLTGVDVSQNGVVFARFTNGRSELLGQVAIANFKNPQGLQQLGENNWAQSYDSGDPVFGEPGDGRLGSIQSAALESSNVDLAEELVDLIQAQRNYQANAQTISTADEVTQTIINIR
ncbi:flagellar hook protein FlgE [Thiorhodococcus minor]|uniref:Flagellar hook protein FlgE n=1 Tax=Thiorhodococcus minor TaxID=57489 RepID=A0A6M0JTF9_9GAMM|nr:flagellar hook protein FlgE [Thiorhodococcus minor]NEV60529.1 flagellar hook protein FlgE [Thiorhodococcus minor]